MAVGGDGTTPDMSDAIAFVAIWALAIVLIVWCFARASH
jgi:hypothetical protein